MNRVILLFVFVCLTNVAVSQQIPQPIIYHGTVPLNVVVAEAKDPELKDLVWHRWTTKNFTVLSLNEQQGEFLAKNVEIAKSWVVERWGLPNIDYSTECRILAVPSKDLMSKLFRIDESRVESRKENGKTKLNIIWLLLDGSPAETIPDPITQVSLLELSESGQFNAPFWARRGMSGLNKTVTQIKQDLNLFSGKLNQGSLFTSESLFTMTYSDWEKMDESKQSLYDEECVVLCLLLRKEFGEAKLHALLKSNNVESTLRQTLSFSNYKQFDSSFFRYARDLSKDVTNGVTPDSYLDITPSMREN